LETAVGWPFRAPFRAVQLELLRSSYTTEPRVAQRTLGSLPNRRDTLKALNKLSRVLYNAFGVTVMAVFDTQGALRDPLLLRGVTRAVLFNAFGVSGYDRPTANLAR